MAAKSKTPAKWQAVTKSQSKAVASGKPKGVIASKKQFSFSPKQWTLVGIGAFILLTATTYLLVQSEQQTTTNAASCTSKIYKQGSKSTCVKYMQQILNASGVAGKVSADGVFGSGTKSAVVKFQKAKKIGADGIVGSGTWKKLCSVSGASSAKAGAGCGASSAKSWKTVSASYRKVQSNKIENTSTIKLAKGHTYRSCVKIENYSKKSTVYISGWAGKYGDLTIKGNGTYCKPGAKMSGTASYRPGYFAATQQGGNFKLKSLYVQEYK